MSADNWTTCHQCIKAAQAKADKAAKKANDSYCKVPLEKFHELTKIAVDLAQAIEDGTAIEMTFREDYELGMIDDGTQFYAIYRGSCSGCGYEYSFRHQEPAKDKGEGGNRQV